MHIQKKSLYLFLCFWFLSAICFSQESWIAQDKSAGLSVGVVSRFENMRQRILQVSVNGKSCCVDSCAFVTNANEFFYFNGSKWYPGSSVDFSRKMIPVPSKYSNFSGVSFQGGASWNSCSSGNLYFPLDEDLGRTTENGFFLLKVSFSAQHGIVALSRKNLNEKNRVEILRESLLNYFETYDWYSTHAAVADYISRIWNLSYPINFSVLRSAAGKNKYLCERNSLVTADMGKKLADSASDYFTTQVSYVPGGIDTCEIYCEKISLANNSKKKSDFSFVSGGNLNNFSSSGCDSLAFLYGSIFRTGFYSSIYGFDDEIKNVFESYSKNFVSYSMVRKNFRKKLTDIDSSLKLNGNLVDRIFCPMPELRFLQAGDVFLRKEKLSVSEYDCAIVVKIDSHDPGGIEVVYMNKKNGKCSRDKLSNIEKYKEYVPARLMVQDNFARKYEDQSWDVFSADDMEATLCYERIYEQGQRVNLEKVWPWIPNTGEYLCLESPYLKITGNRLEEYMKGAEAEIEVHDINHGKTYPFTGTALGNRADSCIDIYADTANGSCHRIGSYYCRKDMAEYKAELKDDVKLFLNPQGTMFVGKTYDYSQKISRLLLLSDDDEFNYGNEICVTIRIIPNGNLSSFCTRKNDESCCFSYYDKKAIWRANLYYNDSFPGNNVVDWNEVHPWDSDDNDWNRKFDSRSDINNMGGLSFGDGGQTVEFMEFSSYRTDGHNVCDTVSYDYNINGIQAWDSPFDFNYKLFSQMKATAQHFSMEYEKNSKQNDPYHSSDYSSSSEKALFPIDSTSFIGGSVTTLLNLSKWESTYAPESLWKFYWKDDASLDYIPYIPGLGFHEYSKGKSFFALHTMEVNDLLQRLKFPAGKSAGTDCLGFVQRATSYAGNKYVWNVNSILPRDRAEKNDDPDSVKRTDSHGLQFPRSGENCDLIVDWQCLFDSDIVPPRTYYSAKASKSESEKNPSESKFEKVRKAFLMIVPGDVISYGSENQTAGNMADRNVLKRGSHIGLICDVNRLKIKKAATLEEILDSITVIESVYSGTIFGVTKRTMLQGSAGGNHNSLCKSENCWISFSKTEFRPWEILRLRVNEKNKKRES